MGGERVLKGGFPLDWFSSIAAHPVLRSRLLLQDFLELASSWKRMVEVLVIGIACSLNTTVPTDSIALQFIFD